MVKPIVSLNITELSVKAGEEVTVSGSVLDPSGPPLKKATMRIEYSLEGGSWMRGPTLITDNNGEFKGKVKLPKGGKYLIRAQFLGGRF